MSSFWMTRDWVGRTAKTTGGVWLAAGLAFASSVVAARRLGVASYGRVVLALSICAFVATFLDVSLEEGVVYLGTKTISLGDTSRLWTLLRTALVVDLLVGVFVWLALFLSASFLSTLVGDATSAQLIRIASLSVLVSTVNGTSGATLLLAKRSHTYAFVQVGAAAALLVLILIAPTLTTRIMWAYVGSAAVGATAMLALALREGIRAWGRPTFSRGAAGTSRQLLRFGFHSSITTSVSAATDSVVPIIVGSMQGASAVAIFAVARLPMSIASLATSPVRTVFLPEQAQLAVQNDRIALRRSVIAYVKVAAALTAFGMIVGWFALPLLIRALYGTSFAAAVEPARILLVAAGVFVTFGWTKMLPVAIGRPELRTRTMGLVSLLILAGTVLLGGTAMAAASSVSFAYAIFALIWIWLLRRLLPSELTAR